MQTRFISAVAAAVLLLAACDDAVAPGVGPELEIVPGDSVVALGSTLTVEAHASDRDGEPIAITWSSGDSSVARVDGAGVVTPVAIGYADIVARAGDLADTLRVRAYDAEVPLGTLRVRFGHGASAPTRDLPGFMKFLDTMGGGPGDEAGLTGTAVVMRDTMLTVLFPGDDHEGRQPIGAWPLDGGVRAGIAALLRFGSAEIGDLEYFASVGGGWIELDLEPGPAPGLRPGRVRGFLHAPLVRLAPVPGGPPVLTTDTLWLHADVHAHYQHNLRGHAVVTLHDGPLVGTSLSSQAWGDDDDRGGWLLAWDADFDGLGSGPGRWELNQELDLVGPAVGSFAFPRFTGPVFGEPSLWPERFSSIFYRDDARVPLVADGTLTITRWLAPTLEDYGQMEGTIDARFELWTPDLTEPTGDTIRATTTFAVPLPPLAGLPAAPPARPTF